MAAILQQHYHPHHQRIDMEVDDVFKSSLGREMEADHEMSYSTAADPEALLRDLLLSTREGSGTDTRDTRSNVTSPTNVNSPPDINHFTPQQHPASVRPAREPSDEIWDLYITRIKPNPDRLRRLTADTCHELIKAFTTAGRNSWTREQYLNRCVNIIVDLVSVGVAPHAKTWTVIGGVADITKASEALELVKMVKGRVFSLFGPRKRGAPPPLYAPDPEKPTVSESLLIGLYSRLITLVGRRSTLNDASRVYNDLLSTWAAWFRSSTSPPSGERCLEAHQAMVECYCIWEHMDKAADFMRTLRIKYGIHPTTYMRCSLISAYHRSGDIATAETLATKLLRAMEIRTQDQRRKEQAASESRDRKHRHRDRQKTTRQRLGMQEIEGLDAHAYGLLLRVYKSAGKTDKALQAYAALVSRFPSSCNSKTFAIVLDALWKAGMVDSAVEFFEELQSLHQRQAEEGEKGTIRNNNLEDGAFGTWVSAPLFGPFTTRKPMEEQHATSSATHPHFPVVHLTSSIYNVMIAGLCKHGRVDEALSLLHEMLCQTSSSSPSQRSPSISSHQQHNHHSDPPSQPLISSPNVYTYTVLIDALMKNGHTDTARALCADMLERGLVPDVATCTAMVHGFVKAREFGAARECLESFLEDGIVVPPPRLKKTEGVKGMTQGCLDGGNKNGDEGVGGDDGFATRGGSNQKMSKHLECRLRRQASKNSSVDETTSSPLPNSASTSSHNTQRKPSHNNVKDLRFYTVVLELFLQTNDTAGIASVRKEMRESGMYPDAPMYNLFVTAYTRHGLMKEAEELVSEMMESPPPTLEYRDGGSGEGSVGSGLVMGSDAGERRSAPVRLTKQVATSLVAGWVRCGNMEKAEEVFRNMFGRRLGDGVEDSNRKALGYSEWTVGDARINQDWTPDHVAHLLFDEGDGYATEEVACEPESAGPSTGPHKTSSQPSHPSSSTPPMTFNTSTTARYVQTPSLTPDHVVYTALINGYLSGRNVSAAMRLYDEFLQAFHPEMLVEYRRWQSVQRQRSRLAEESSEAHLTGSSEGVRTEPVGLMEEGIEDGSGSAVVKAEDGAVSD
ncbi:hypothetical protein HK102_004793, partial [Quaeritorhiza haematococci]